MTDDQPTTPDPAPAESSPAPADGLRTLPVLPLRTDVVFPQSVVPLVVGRPKAIQLIDEVVKGDKIVAFATQRKPETEEPGPQDLYEHVSIGSILKMLRFPDGTTRIVAQGMERGRIEQVARTKPFLVARIRPLPDVVQQGVELDAQVVHVQRLFRRVAELSPQMPEELQAAVMSVREPGQLADLIGASLPFTIEEKHKLLAEPNVLGRLELLGTFLRRQVEVLELSSKIQSQVGSELSRAQREHFLREQLKAIRQELGEGAEPELAELREKIEQAGMTEEAHKEAVRELDRLEQMHPSSAEYSVVRTYLDWLVSLPWKKASKDRIDIPRARKILDEDHYDLDKVKDRILEYLAVRKLKRDMRGPILCFVGPPGTGKTSLGRSIARALGRQFVRLSLGGVRDEAEIRGHRRTYIGALPGRIIQELRKAGTNNPVFMLDEVDKLGSDFRGDPSSALLEVLDPEQNFSFRDHYLDVTFDLSRVMFLCTANVPHTIPPPLLDRMEVLELPGYSEEEKLHIARQYVVPKQLREHGLKPADLELPDETVVRVIGEYTREAGLRNLEREIATLCRKVARRRAEGHDGPVTIRPEDLEDYLGPPKHFRELADRAAVPGVATGLAWTPVGGQILFIEATRMKGKGGLQLTGSLGEVMKESAHAALSYLRSHAQRLDIDPDFFREADVHVHVPAGAVAKDGPSAGVALFAALASLLRGQTLPDDLAMTGEITLSGRVLPVGGIKEKLLAARRAGVKRVILPKHNAKDIPELPEEVRRDLTLHFVESIDEVVPILFPETAAETSDVTDGRRRTAEQAVERASAQPNVEHEEMRRHA